MKRSLAGSLASRSLACPLLLSGAAFAQSTIVVDDSGGPGVQFTDLQAAVQSAAAGDLLLVREGAYGGLSIEGKGVSIVREDPQAVVQIQSTVVRDLPAGQSVLLQGLSLSTTAVLACEGSVSFSRCEIQGESSPIYNDFFQVIGADVPHSLEILGSASVLLVESEVTSTGGFFDFGLGFLPPPTTCQVENSSVFFHGSQVSGYPSIQNTAFTTLPPARGIQALNSDLASRNCEFTGGAPNPSFFPATWPAAPALETCDSTVSDHGSTFVEGLQTCSSAPTQPTLLPAGPADLSVPSVIASGAIASIELAGAPGSFPFLLASPSTSAIYLPQIRGFSAVGLEPILVPLGVHAGPGPTVLDLPTAQVPPGLSIPLTVQVLFGQLDFTLDISQPNWTHIVG